MAPELAPTLLEPFRRINAERSGRAGGLGVGLSIVAAIAEVHDARPQVIPGRAVGSKSTYRFRLHGPFEVSPWRTL